MIWPRADYILEPIAKKTFSGFIFLTGQCVSPSGLARIRVQVTIRYTYRAVIGRDHHLDQ